MLLDTQVIHEAQAANGDQTHYALTRLDEAARTITQSVNEMPMLRRRLEKNKDKQAKAREIYNDLSQLRDRCTLQSNPPSCLSWRWNCRIWRIILLSSASQ